MSVGLPVCLFGFRVKVFGFRLDLGPHGFLTSAFGSCLFGIVPRPNVPVRCPVFLKTVALAVQLMWSSPSGSASVRPGGISPRSSGTKVLYGEVLFWFCPVLVLVHSISPLTPSGNNNPLHLCHSDDSSSPPPRGRRGHAQSCNTELLPGAAKCCLCLRFRVRYMRRPPQPCAARSPAH